MSEFKINENKIDKLANLAVKRGVGLQKGQNLLITIIKSSEMISCDEILEAVLIHSRLRRFCRVALQVLGRGIFAVDGPEWQRQRKVASHLFSTRALQEQMEGVSREAACLSRCEDSAPVCSIVVSDVLLQGDSRNPSHLVLIFPER